jgi:hypothetical protein
MVPSDPAPAATAGPPGSVPLSPAQLDRRSNNTPALDPEEVQAAHLSGRKLIVNVSHIELGGNDHNGRRFNVRPGMAVLVTSTFADYLLREDTSGRFELYDAKRHGPLNKQKTQLEKPYAFSMPEEVKKKESKRPRVAKAKRDDDDEDQGDD